MAVLLPFDLPTDGVTCTYPECPKAPTSIVVFGDRHRRVAVCDEHSGSDAVEVLRGLTPEDEPGNP